MDTVKWNSTDKPPNPELITELGLSDKKLTSVPELLRKYINLKL